MFNVRRILWVSLLLTAILSRASGEVRKDLEAAALRFRLQTYQSYRSNRMELDRRNAAARHVLDEWEQRGALEEEIADIVKWFQRAQRLTSSAPFPEYRGVSQTDGAEPSIQALPSKKVKTPPEGSPTELPASHAATLEAVFEDAALPHRGPA